MTNTIIAYIVCCGNFSTFSGKYSRIVASSQRNHLGCAVRLCQSVAIGRSCSVTVICFASNHDDDKLWPSNASSLKSKIDRGLGNVLELSPSLNGGEEIKTPETIQSYEIRSTGCLCIQSIQKCANQVNTLCCRLWFFWKSLDIEGIVPMYLPSCYCW